MGHPSTCLVCEVVVAVVSVGEEDRVRKAVRNLHQLILYEFMKRLALHIQERTSFADPTPAADKCSGSIGSHLVAMRASNIESTPQHHIASLGPGASVYEKYRRMMDRGHRMQRPPLKTMRMTLPKELE
jgi:hypothetical protein